MRFLWIFILAWPAFAADAPISAAETKLRAEMKAHVVLKHETWSRMLNRPMPLRVGPPSSLVLEYLTLDNALNGFAPPKTGEFNREFRRMFKELGPKLPPGIRKILGERLAGIFAVKDLGTTGFTEAVRDKTGKVVAAFIVLDADRIQKPVNEWATEKDSSLFQKGEYQLKVKMAADNANRPLETMEFIVLHEMAHVLALFNQQMPFWEGEPTAEWNKFAFLNLSWQPPKFAEVKFPNRPKVTLGFYKTPENANAKIPEVYDWLERTNFATLYSVSSRNEDYADSLASWVRLKKFGKPYSLTVFKGSAVVKTYLSCFSTNRCADKAKLFESIWK